MADPVDEINALFKMFDIDCMAKVTTRKGYRYAIHSIHENNGRWFVTQSPLWLFKDEMRFREISHLIIKEQTLGESI